MNELGFIPVTLIPIVWIVLAYLIGSISFGIIVSKVYLACQTRAPWVVAILARLMWRVAARNRRRF